ncbi:hypothetical protein KI809_08730 [Geobacter pelophilus]|uniref:Hemerythrin-like domain-containing protein n=1 Tax=Geoanaerobacter pelophilus TaxID=60036 RepID=A0AAW4L0E4_9BACT|nr:hypothetical protein [Geoanaerobacter pelophilus]MBT0664383.1 hypothetical protein [Geoanaerobacter pelophilus]
MVSLDRNIKLDPTVDLLNIYFNKMDECIKLLNDTLKDNEGDCALTNELLNQLKQLYELHFMHEEQLLAGMNYPTVNEQKVRHGLFLKSFEPLQLKSDQCHTPGFINDFSQIRLDFIFNMNDDTMEICDYIISNYH